ncbi:MAG: anti-sigma factor domain-containing protein, partial [Candidatus Binatia bacterium]
MNHEEWLESAEVYALGALDGEELSRFETHLAGCGLCEGRVRETRETLTVLPRSLAQVAPPDSIREKLLTRIAAETVVPIPTRPQTRWVWWGVGSGALAAAGLLIALTWNVLSTRQELQSLHAQVAGLRLELTKQEEIIGFLSNPQVRLVSLAGLPPSPNAIARLLWDPVNRSGLLLTVGLPEIPAEKDYELWGIAGTEPVAAGVFKVDRQ